MARMTVSVIIPCYNCSAYIEETLRSLAAQQQLPDEVICVNDGSTDCTADIIAAAARESVLNIRLLHQPNSGVSAARNTGIEAAQSELLLFLDADDGYAPGFIRAVAENAADCDCVYTWFARKQEELSAATPEASFCTKAEAMAEFMYYKGRCHTGAFAYRRALLENSGLRFTPGARYGEDWEFTTKYLDLCQRIRRVPQRLMFYRRSEDSAMARISYAHADAIAAAERTEQFLQLRNSDCLELFRGYMRHRAVFATAHTFAKAGRKDLFERLRRGYDVHFAMKQLAKNPNADYKSRLAALSYCISPSVFFHITGKR